MLRTYPLLLLLFLVVGCRSTFRYDAPSARLNATGPSIAVLPIVDKRADVSIDKAIKRGYLANMQQAIVAELQSMNRFSEVRPAVGADPSADLILEAELHDLQWEIPEYKKQLGQAAAVGVMFGLAGGAVYLSTSTDVNGFCKLDVLVETTATPRRKFRRTYQGAVSETRSKGTSDTARTRSTMASKAFRSALKTMKEDLDDQVRGYTGHLKQE